MRKCVRVVPDDAIRVDNRMYFISGEFNGLFYSEYGEEKAHFIGSIPGEIVNQKRLYGSMQCVDNRYICLIPFTAEAFTFYDIELDCFLKISVPNTTNNQKPKFMPSVVIGSDIYLFEMFGTKIYKICVEQQELVEVHSWSNSIREEMFFNKDDAFFRYQVIVKDERIYIPFCNANAILIYDYINNTSSIHVLGDDKNGYSGICLKGDKMFLSPRNTGNHGVLWDLANNAVSNLSESEESIIGVIANDDKPCYFSGEKYAFLRSDKIITYSYDKKKILHEENGITKEWSIEVCTDEFGSIKDVNINTLINETAWFGLDTFIKCVNS